MCLQRTVESDEKTGAGFWLWALVWCLCAGMIAGCGASSDPETRGGGMVRTESSEKVTLLSAYPATRKTNQVDHYHGVAVADPYRWLEDDRSSETEAWIEAQNHLTFGYLDQIPERPAIRRRLTDLWNYERYGVPFKEGNRYFLYRNDGLQNQSVLFTMDELGAEPRVLLDPNQLSGDGTIALSGVWVSPDGQRLAYGISVAGSDWREFKVRDVTTGRDLDDHLKWIKFSGASWRRDGSGFYYSRYDEPESGQASSGANYFQKLYFHRMGTSQQEDVLIYERPDQKEWGFSGEVTEDDRYLIMTVWQGTDRRNRVYYREVGQPDGPVVALLDDFDASYSFIGNDGPVFWFRTDMDAPRSRVIEVDTRHPGRAHWREIIPEQETTLRGVTLVGQRFMCHYLKDARSVVSVHDHAGKFMRQIDLPGLGSVSGFGGKAADPETFYSFTSFTSPGTIYRYDVNTGKSELFKQPKVDFNSDDYTTEQVFVRSKDGTPVPMFLSFKKGFRKNGAQAALLYGYGGFNISQTPRFSVANLAWMEMGGLYAVANLRGGSEYGEPWHEAGMKGGKQNVFDDFLAAAEWLIEHRYTSRKKLAIMGRSNGGLLVGACLTQRPELFGAALPAVGVMDMLRFHKFTIGWAWTSEYGSSDEAEDFKILYQYSPLHRLQTGVKYPPTLITTADHDDRVVPAHSFKFAARMQECQAGPDPILIRIETRAGHGAGKPTSKRIDEAADQWAFLVESLNMR